MSLNDRVFENDERIIFKLRELYSKYGYMKYRMSKFEEYDLYVRNKDFLVSENIITFTDVDGKLMALKPDVTLSIIKNSRDTSGVQKMYYNENVYRASNDTRAFKEIMQTGLEAFGDIDSYCISEVVLLAAKSLECISNDYILDISHMGIISEALDSIKVSEKGRRSMLKSLGEKNMSGISAVCREEGLEEADAELLKKLVAIYGEPDEVLTKLKTVTRGERFDSAIRELEDITEVLSQNGCADKIRIDFSVINDMSYYSGVVFKGFVNGVPGGVLSGGQYDNLMKKMNRKSGAIGFAVYLDMLERLYEDNHGFDVDAVLVYEEGARLCDISRAVKKITEGGETVVAQKTKPEKIRYKRLLKLCGTEVETVENNA
ncbi:MAG: ATP phosphoribosyltransferase regulatory subunit [Clostridia bacterium]|nr:ATP phosphoribosyltransferase regulatory subunit [Clostridia bacterium]